jgi:lysophospholipase L1-like esterase
MTRLLLGLALLLPAFAQELPPEIFSEGQRILFQGDSITDGNRGRSADPNHILGHGYAFIIAAKYGASFPEQKLDFVNRGISGHKVTDLKARWKADTLDLKPDVLSILVGVNDAGSVVRNQQPVSPEEFEKVYDELIVETRAANPNVKIILCEPFILAVGKVKEQWAVYLPDVTRRQEAVARLAAKHKLPLVRFQKMFDEACKKAPADYWIWDGVHPTYRGHQLMADEWVKVAAAARSK